MEKVDEEMELKHNEGKDGELYASSNKFHNHCVTLGYDPEDLTVE